MSPLPLAKFRNAKHKAIFPEGCEISSWTQHEIRWQLQEIRVYSSGITLLWYPTSYSPLITVPPGFLPDDMEQAPPASEEKPLTQLPVSDTPAVGLSPDDFSDATDTIPFRAGVTNTPLPMVDSAQYAMAKRRVREARLRVAVARLRAERLAKRFLEKYGDLNPTEGSDSGLSSESEQEVVYPKNIGSH